MSGDADTLPIVPGELDPEMRAFMSRLMTGYESMARSCVSMADSAMARANAAEANAQKAIEARLKAVQEYEELLSQRHERDLSAQIAAHRVAAFGDIARDIRALAPLLLKKLLGAPLTGKDSHGMQDLINSMSEDQVEALMMRGELKLSEAQRHLMAATLMSLAEAEQANKAPALEAENKDETDGRTE